jgi:hypothetical protein
MRTGQAVETGTTGGYVPPSIPGLPRRSDTGGSYQRGGGGYGV